MWDMIISTSTGEHAMSDTSQFQDRYHIRFQGRRTTVTLDKILSELIAMSFGLTPDRTDYHSTVQQWLQATLTDKLGENVPGGSHISQYARNGHCGVLHLSSPVNLFCVIKRCTRMSALN